MCVLAYLCVFRVRPLVYQSARCVSEFFLFAFVLYCVYVFFEWECASGGYCLCDFSVCACVCVYVCVFNVFVFL